MPCLYGVNNEVFDGNWRELLLVYH